MKDLVFTTVLGIIVVLVILMIEQKFINKNQILTGIIVLASAGYGLGTLISWLGSF